MLQQFQVPLKENYINKDSLIDLLEHFGWLSEFTSNFCKYDPALEKEAIFYWYRQTVNYILPTKYAKYWYCFIDFLNNWTVAAVQTIPLPTSMHYNNAALFCIAGNSFFSKETTICGHSNRF